MLNYNIGVSHPLLKQVFNILDLQKLDLIEVLSALLRGEAQIVGGVLELADYRAAGDGPESVTGF